MLSGIGSTIAQGMAFGTGSAIAHNAIGAVAGSMGGGSDEAPQHDDQQQAQMPPAAQQLSGGACVDDKQMFFDCLQHNRGDQEACKFLYSVLQECQSNQNTMSFN
mmetsp:Transcript_12138/g.12185  ORF Transcript_12138/g.12185 Transcript_12138/m.12185 type:complete len:105 (-) Transcript_12138:380-694(-)